MTKGNGGAEVLESLGNALQKGVERAGFSIEGPLEETLKRIQSGDAKALLQLPPDLRAAVGVEIANAIEGGYELSAGMEAAMEAFQSDNYEAAVSALEGAFREGYVDASCIAPDGALYGSAFFARDMATVAKHLCGSSLVHAEGVAQAWGGVVTHTGAYKPTKKDKHIAEARPGTIGAWPSQGHHITIISAHKEGGAGTVAVWGMGQLGDQLSMGNVGAGLEVKAYEERVIGEDAPIDVQPRNLAVDRVGGLEVRKLANAKGASPVYGLKK